MLWFGYFDAAKFERVCLARTLGIADWGLLSPGELSLNFLILLAILIISLIMGEIFAKYRIYHDGQRILQIGTICLII